MKTINAVLVDPFNRTVTDITLDAQEREDADDSYLNALYLNIKCHMVDVQRQIIAGRGVDLWVDDEGLIRGPTCLTRFDCARGVHTTLAGRIVVADTDNDGNLVASPLRAHEVQRHVRWLGLSVPQDMVGTPDPIPDDESAKLANARAGVAAVTYIQSTIGNDMTEDEALLMWQFGMNPQQRGWALKLYEVSSDLRAPRN